MSSNTPKRFQFPRPSTYTPFWRRWFVDERARERIETKRLFDEVTARYEARWGDRAPLYNLISAISGELNVPASVKEPLVSCFHAILSCESEIWPIEEPEWPHLGMKDLVELRTLLRAQQHFLNHEEVCTDLLIEYVSLIINGLADEIPTAPEGRPLFTIPLCELLPDVNTVIERLINTIINDKLDEHHVMSEIARELYLNLCAASDVVPDSNHKPIIVAVKHGRTPLEVAQIYLADTPFLDLFSAPIPFAIPAPSFFEHMHVVGGTGAGKTSWLAQLILHHLDDPDQPAIVVVDSQGGLIPTLRTLERIEDRILYIDPEDPPAINIFDTRAGAGDTFDYLFDGIVGADLTGKQAVFFDFLTRFMLSFPRTMGRAATLRDMIAITADITPYQHAIAQLPEVARTFFERDFGSATFKQTREQVRYRLNALLADEKLERLFGEHTEVNLGAALDRGDVILVDTSKQYLGKQSAKFGRLFIFLVLQEIFSRTPYPQGNPHPVFLIVDEAHEYFDQNIDNLLTQVRKYRCGCVFAHQFLSQATSDLRASMASNTSIKMVSGVSMADARALAPDLRTTADFILAQPKLHFATFVKHVTKQAISIAVEPGLLEREEHIPLQYRPLKRPRRPQPSVAPPTSTTGHSVEPTRSPDEIDTSATDGW